MSQLATRRHATVTAVTPHVDPGEPGYVLVEQAAGMAAMLVSASPAQAKAFAVAMHERCCETGADEQTRFWLSVVDALTAPGEPAVHPVRLVAEAVPA